MQKQRSRLGNEVLLGDEEEDEDEEIEEEEEEDREGSEEMDEEEEEEAIVYETPAMKKRRDRDIARGLGKPLLVGKGKGKEVLGLIVDDVDEEMEDAPVIGDLDDAEGEDE